MNSKEVAQIILDQLGGNKFIAMTGSKNFGSSEDKNGNPYIQMKLAKNKSKAQYLTITLNGTDLYDMKFIKMDKSYNIEIIAEYKGLFENMLKGLFTKVTGLETHL